MDQLTGQLCTVDMCALGKAGKAGGLEIVGDIQLSGEVGAGLVVNGGCAQMDQTDTGGCLQLNKGDILLRCFAIAIGE